MRWTPGGRSGDLEDRRGSGGGFGGGGMRIGLGGAAVLLVLSLIFKQNFFALVGADGQGSEPTASGPVACSVTAAITAVTIIEIEIGIAIRIYPPLL